MEWPSFDSHYSLGKGIIYFCVSPCWPFDWCSQIRERCCRYDSPSHGAGVLRPSTKNRHLLHENPEFSMKPKSILAGSSKFDGKVSSKRFFKYWIFVQFWRFSLSCQFTQNQCYRYQSVLNVRVYTYECCTIEKVHLYHILSG